MESLENEIDQHYLIYVDETSLGINFPVFQEMRRMNIVFDVVFKVNDVTIPAHRVVLAATSPYFHGMLTNDTSESRNNEIIIEGVEAHALESLINFIYTGEVRIDAENVENLIRGASYLLLTKVQEACAEFLTTEMTPHNALGIRELADALSCTHLLVSAKKFITENFCEVSKSEEFSSLDLDKFLELIESDEINEDIRFNACMRWIKYDTKERAPLLPTVLAKFPLRLLSWELLANCVNREKLIQSSPKCRDLINNAKETYSSLGKHVAVGVADNWKFIVEIYDRIVKKWQIWDRFALQRKSRYSEKAVFLDGKFYIFYYDTSAKIIRCEVYDIKTKTMSQLRSPSLNRILFSPAASDGRIYICGGCDDDISQYYDNVECYNLETGLWTNVASMPTKLVDPGVGILDGKLYVCGGENDKEDYNNEVCRYEPTIDKWVKLSPMNNKLHFTSVAAIEGKLYVMDRESVKGKVIEVYNPTTNTWETLTTMRSVDTILSAFIGELWIVFDLGHNNDTKCTTEIYNPKTKIWRNGPFLSKIVKTLALGILH